MASGISDSRIVELIQQHSAAAKLHRDTMEALRILMYQRSGTRPTGRTAPVWSDERVAALIEGWTTNESTYSIWTRVNAMPGPRISTPKVVAYKAADLKLRRPVLEKPKMIIKRPKGLTTEDLIEGDKNLRAGWKPAQIADWFGCTLEDAQEWHRTWHEVTKAEKTP